MTRFMHYMIMGSLHINGSESGVFNVSWKEWWEILGFGPSLGLEFLSIRSPLLALVWVKVDDFIGTSRKVRHG